MDACSSDYSEWSTDEKWSSQEWKYDEALEARTGRPVSEQPAGLFTQQTDRFVIADDDMDSNTVTDLDLSLKSRSFLYRVNDRVRKRQKRSSMKVTEDGGKHSVIWRMFMSETLESAILMGKNYQDKLEVTTSYLQGKSGVEIRIEVINKDNSHSSVTISHGLNKLVTDFSNNKENDNNEQETSEMQFENFPLKTDVLNFARRSKAKAKCKQKVEKTPRHGEKGLIYSLLNGKDCSSIKQDRTQSSFTTHSQLTVYRKLFGWETGEVIYEKVNASPRLPPKIACKDNWIQKLLEV